MPTPLRRAKLPRTFYARDTITVARELLGTLLVRRAAGVDRVGMIVETEAYLGSHDMAAHARHGKTRRNASLFGPCGHAYVYMIYGMHECMNVVTGPPGWGGAVLIRALEPVQYCDARTNGPGLLSRAMGISRTLDGHDLLSDDLFIAENGAAPRIVVRATRRVGVDYAGHWARRRLRFHISRNAFVSRT
jgi:DNA-3-methyladenine glycosylase